MTEREQKVLALVQKLSQVAGANPTPEQPLFESGILDSFGLPDLVSALEGEFGVSVPDEDLLPENFASLRAIDSYLARRAG